MKLYLGSLPCKLFSCLQSHDTDRHLRAKIELADVLGLNDILIVMLTVQLSDQSSPPQAVSWKHRHGFLWIQSKDTQAIVSSTPRTRKLAFRVPCPMMSETLSSHYHCYCRHFDRVPMVVPFVLRALVQCRVLVSVRSDC